MNVEEKHPEITSRRGYLLKDLSRSFQQSLGESGSVAIGKLIHYTADMVASGGLSLLEKLCWEYAYDHIGIASPRIFHYLNRKFRELNEKFGKLLLDVFCKTIEIQQQIIEIVLILQLCPKKTKSKYPTIPVDSHNNDEWLRGVLRTTDKASVRKVWNHSKDMEQMLHAGNEMVYAITEGASERALFWVKWLIEEDAIVKKQHGSHLSTTERGPAGVSNKIGMGYYIISILAEVYKEFAEKGMIRMHEEFQSLLDIYRASDIPQKRKMDTIGIMVHLLTDVPKWKVPAAPSLVTDQATLERIVSQSSVFFNEVLSLPAPNKNLPTTVTGIKKKKGQIKDQQLHNKLNQIDNVMMSFYNF